LPDTPDSGSFPNQPGMGPGADGYVYWDFTAGTTTYTTLEIF
jgi:hypothetical protein